MKKVVRVSFIVRFILFLIHFYFLFASLYCIMGIKYVGIIFMLLYTVYIFNYLHELLSKEKKYQLDLAYNIMQSGFLFYIIIISLRINFSRIYVTNVTATYFNVNYGILGLLILFILSYKILEFKPNKKRLK